MKKLLLLLFSLTLTAVLVGCSNEKNYEGENETKTEEKAETESEGMTKTYDIEGFKNFDISSDFKVEIVKGDEYKVEVTTDKDVFDKIDVTLENDTLKANCKPAFSIVNLSKKIEMKVTCKNVKDFKVLNDSSIELKSKFETDENVKIEASNDASFKGELMARNLEIKASNDADVNLMGKFADAKIKASNDAKVDLSNATVENIDATASNDANLVFYANKDVKVSASNSSIVNVLAGNVVEKSETQDAVINIKK